MIDSKFLLVYIVQISFTRKSIYVNDKIFLLI